jgi:galactose mutarotase-like enzyme
MTYTIKNEELNVTVDLKGAELKSIRKGEVEYMHDANPTYWGRTAPYLFPNVGTIKDQQAVINGTAYPLPKHGFIRDQQFMLKEFQEHKLTLSFRATADTMKLYPFDFLFEVTYELTGATLSTTIRVVNLTGDTMPFNLGLHPAFKIPLYSDEKFEDYQIIFSVMQSFNIPTVFKDGTIDDAKTTRTFKDLKVLPLSYEDYKNDALIFDKIKSKSVYLFNEKTKKGIKLSFKDFKTLGVWTPNQVKSPFICLEPWIGQGDAPTTNHDFASKKDIMKLDPNQSFETTYKIAIL